MTGGGSTARISGVVEGKYEIGRHPAVLESLKCFLLPTQLAPGTNFLPSFCVDFARPQNMLFLTKD
jgi:hypothetical protein